MLLLFNPQAGLQRFPPVLFNVIDMLTAAGFLVTAYPTQAPGEIRYMVMQYAKQADYLVVSGGDGTVAEAIDALISLKRPPVFAIIPSGTVNDFAGSLGIPNEILEAVRVIINGREKSLDIGRFGKKHFTYVAAFGLFTDVSYATPQDLKNILGNLAYFLEGARRIGSVQPFYCHFNLDGEEIAGEFILGMVSNAQSIGGIKLKDEKVRMDDGLFEVILFPKPENILDVISIITSAIQQEGNDESLIIRRVRKVTVKAKKPIAWTLDGEYGGTYMNVTISNLHQVVKIIN
jgi:YegS/Rv2252/BmrU family lipid kinase